MTFHASGEDDDAFHEHARSLATQLKIISGPAPLGIYYHLRRLPVWLERVRRYALDPDPAHSRAADWLLDNDYQIARTVRRLGEDLPPAFFDRLIAVETTTGTPLPRVYVIAHAILQAGEMHLSADMLVRYINAYQQVTPLTIAELWAFPSMLNLASLEILAVSFEQLNADLPVPFVPSALTEDMAPSDPSDRIAIGVARFQALHAIEWRDFVDRTSRVEHILKTDPGGAYAGMMFQTRNRYRSRVEELASRSAFSETEVAEKVIAMAKACSDPSRARHVGYWLIGDGHRTLETSLAAEIPWLQSARRFVMRHAGKIYAFGLTGTVIAALIVPALHLAMAGAGPVAWIAGMMISFIPATVVSISLVHWLITLIIPPRHLAMMDYRKAIPDDCKTAVAVPVILAGTDEIPAIMERLEVRYLSNPDPKLTFLLLSDFADAQAEHCPQDEEVEKALVASIDTLNRRYGKQNDGPFCLLHRRRRYNPAEGCWMGWERKRGKLEQLNAYVLNGDIGDFAVRASHFERLKDTRFVITLDADTALPRDAAARLIGTLAHPLNQAVFDAQTGRVVSGYTIVQPRIDVLATSGLSSNFSRLYSGNTAIDIYSHAVSDVYQDLFGSGVFVGKGIYDVAAFHRSLDGAVSENTVLSHDLLEGLHGRTALATSIVLYEDFPANYPEYALRLHRWIRGDWQLIPWLGRRTPAGQGNNGLLPLLDRWKILDNLRRSLIAPSLLLFFIAGWMMFPGSAWLWTALAFAAPGTYLIGEIFSTFARDIRRGLPSDFIRNFVDRGGRWFVTIAFLVSDTLVSIDAIIRTLWRMQVSRKKLLEWRTAAHVSERLRGGSARGAVWRLMWASAAVSLLLATSLMIYDRSALLPATPILVLWFFAPEIAVWLGRSQSLRREEIDGSDRVFLKKAARRTWLYFETFAGPKDHWLPPDNYQEDPKGVVAHRTSPTNIGLYLTSALAAHDFGFAGAKDFAARVRNTLDTVDRFETYRGQILNWYDTRSLEPLEPRYVSTVDNGNLAVCLLSVAEGCRYICDGPLIKSDIWDGLACTFDVLIEEVQTLAGHEMSGTSGFQKDFERVIDAAQTTPERWIPLVDELKTSLWPAFEQAIGEAVEKAENASRTQLAAVYAWLERFQHHIDFMERNIRELAPWLTVTANPPDGLEAIAHEIAVSLLHNRPNAEAVKQLIAKALVPGDPWLADLQAAVEDSIKAQGSVRQDAAELAGRCEAMAFGMDFTFLYDPDVRLFRIGYNVSTGQADANHYDLLASEARLASFFAVAKHDVPQEHWFFLGRPITRLRGHPSILSWNGSMFEYLMPPLFLPRKRYTLLGESESTAVEYQQDYARKHGLPWGISESAFAVTDADGNYQYRAFGAPGLGLRRGLGEDYVVAPYASALALCCWPKAAVENLERLYAEGASGLYGFYDALDFTPDRVSKPASGVPVKTYMAHHHGMAIAAIANALNDDVFVRRFMANKAMRTVELLLQERIPWGMPIETGRLEEEWRTIPYERGSALLAPWVPSPEATVPQVHLLGNGSFSALISKSGAGGMSWRGNALTRWLPDTTRDQYGYWIYVSDTDSNAVWSTGRLPTGTRSEDATVVFHQHMVEMFRRDHDIALRTEITVAPGDPVDIRRVTVVNEGDADRVLEFTSYGEVVLAPPIDDERHPAFSKLFVKSSFVQRQNGLLFTRNSRRPERHPPVLLHRATWSDPGIELAGFDASRASFISRNGDLRHPKAMTSDMPGHAGWTLDPIMAIRIRVHLKPMQSKSFSFVTIAGETKGDVLRTSDRYSHASHDQVFHDAQRAAGREVERLEIDPVRLPDVQALASVLLHPHAALRCMPRRLEENRIGQPGLWQFGISGDVPILLLRMGRDEQSGLLELLLRAQRLWERGGLQVDIVVLRTEAAGYEEPLRERIHSILRDSHTYGYLGKTGGIHLVSSANIGAETRRALEAAAYVVLDDDDEALGLKIERILEHRSPPPPLLAFREPHCQPQEPLQRPSNLAFDNGLGGFDPENGDYIIHLEDGTRTPAPWCNVLANDDFGTIVSEAGLGFTWAGNSGENRITPWSNDPVCDTPSEALYLRDEETAAAWTITPAPMGNASACQIRHGAGYTRWQRRSHGLEQEMTAFVPVDEPVKVVTLKLHNTMDAPRRITVTYYAEWLLGALGSRAMPHVCCEFDIEIQAILASNVWNPDFAGNVAFLAASQPAHSVTGDRGDFIGSEGHPGSPAGMRNSDLGGRFEPGGDSCGAYQVHLDIPPDGTTEVVFVLGHAPDRSSAHRLITRWTNIAHAHEALEDVGRYWEGLLGAVTVKTPDPAFNIITNRWLPYQTIASRLTARAGFYQAGGAFGMRDQLQDVLAVLHCDPQRVRRHILKAAAQQFEEGDALHWWHPPSGRGIRTRCSDDYIWLAFVTARYVEATGDETILGETVPFLSAEPLQAGEDDRYAQFQVGAEATILEHCMRAFDHMMSTGAHGLPLIGTGDWNDGMDRVGDKGHGESVWLAWFQIATITRFAPLLARHAGKAHAARLEAYASSLGQAARDHAWDGAWFMRAFDDDGEPWGSQSNDECQIDAIAQSWAVIANGTPDEQVRTAMASARSRLVHPEERLVQLLDPPFETTQRDPGYIKAYPPGVRENGGQYTHAAAWMGLAFAGLGDGDEAWRVFDIINPIRRTQDQADAIRYAREPYVLAADVYGPGQNAGLGGWTWYTGAAGWTWQLGVEAILGLQRVKGALKIDPCLPRHWGGAEATINGRKGSIAVTIDDPDNLGHGDLTIAVDGRPRKTARPIAFPGKGKIRHVTVRIHQKGR